MYRYMQVTISRDLGISVPEHFADETSRYYKGSLITLASFYTSLWAVKLSFLLFFKRLTADINFLRIQWWIIFAVTILSYPACFTTVQYRCIVPSLGRFSRECADDEAVFWNYFSLRFNCALDIATDCLSKNTERRYTFEHYDECC